MRVFRTRRLSSRILRWAMVPAIAALALSGCATDAAGTSTTDTDAGTHVVKHARGETAVPDHPQRVVVLEPVQLDTSIALSVVPVGAAVLNEAKGVPSYLGEESAGVKMVGTVPEPSIEKIAALKPDLILGTESRHSALYDQLSDIAPTLFMASQADPWRDNVHFVATALGDEAGASRLLDAYDQRCSEVATAHDVAGTTVQFVRPRDGVLTLYGPESFAGSTLECAGFTIPDRDWENSISVDISPERVMEAQADYVLVTAADVDDPSAIPDSIRSNKASFPQLDVADQSFWVSGVGPLGGMAVLDDIERILSASD